MSWIVIVEDDEAQRELMQVALLDLGVWERVDVLADGDSALAALLEWATSEHHPDLVLLDLRLPGRSGHEILQALQLRGLRPPMPIVVLSSSSLETDLNRAVSLGARDYCVKPLGYVALAQLMRSLTERWLRPPDTWISAPT